MQIEETTKRKSVPIRLFVLVAGLLTGAATFWIGRRNPESEEESE